MAIKGDRLGLGLFAARDIRMRLGADVRDARLNAGLSQRAAGAAVGMSHTEFGRVERGELRMVGVEQLSRACAAVGLRLVARAYPDGDPLRDAAQLRLIARFRAVLPTGLMSRTEVPLPIAGDLRAWDMVVRLGDCDVAVEAETRVRDVQALDRRHALKRRDSGISIEVLVISDTEANRRAIRMARDALRVSFPLDARDVLPALRAGRAPPASGIVFI